MKKEKQILTQLIYVRNKGSTIFFDFHFWRSYCFSYSNALQIWNKDGLVISLSGLACVISTKAWLLMKTTVLLGSK